MTDRKHWDAVYARHTPEGVSWFQPHLDRSLRLIETAGVGRDEEIIDIGGGASTLVDDLLERGFTRVTVLDISPAALQIARARLGERAARVRWIEGDVTCVELPAARYTFWHDRAVFHFLLDPGDGQRYIAALTHSLRRGGHALIATFGVAAPEKCSGLGVRRYAAEELNKMLGPEFTPVRSETEMHRTPSGSEQPFLYGLYRRREDDWLLR